MLQSCRNGLAASTCRCKQRVPSIKCAMDATFGDASNDSTGNLVWPITFDLFE